LATILYLSLSSFLCVHMMLSVWKWFKFMR
jgi:hypothetical protein